MISLLPGALFLIPFLTALVCILVGRAFPRLPWWLAIGALTLTLALTLMGARHVAIYGDIPLFMGGWRPPLGIEWSLDPLGVFGAAIVTTLSLLTLGGTREAVRRELAGREMFFYTCSLILVGGLMGMALTSDLFNLFVHLEVSSLSAYGLASAGGRGAPRAAFNYLLIGSIGASLYLLGVGFLFAATGTLNMADAGARLAEANPNLVALSLAMVCVGLGVKMGLFPLHGWMPAAYSKTSIASASLMAPLVTKISALALIRILLDVYALDSLPSARVLLRLLFWAGAVAMIAGSVFALMQRDLRRLLVYSSVSQLGLGIVGIGLANPLGITGGLLHLVNDALMKGGLFLAAGVALLRFGVRDVEDLKRLRGRAPWTAAAIAVAGFSLIGLPPFCGFFGKWYVLSGALQAQQWVIAGAVVAGSVVTAVYVFRILEPLFFAPVEPGIKDREGPGLLVVACVILALGVILFGLASDRVVSAFVAPGLGLN